MCLLIRFTLNNLYTAHVWTKKNINLTGSCSWNTAFIYFHRKPRGQSWRWLPSKNMPASRGERRILQKENGKNHREAVFPACIPLSCFFFWRKGALWLTEKRHLIGEGGQNWWTEWIPCWTECPAGGALLTENKLGCTDHSTHVKNYRWH